MLRKKLDGAASSVARPQLDAKADVTQRNILDAAILCFANQGWAATSMSLIARETGMTRGKIQYYFPVLDDLKFAAIEHLNLSWRVRYFDTLKAIADTREKFDVGVDLLWKLAQGPLYAARQELDASARTDAALRRTLEHLRAGDEEMSVEATKNAFPAMAEAGAGALQLSRYFTTAFIDGLSSYRFSTDSREWQAALIAMLKECLADFWERRGVVSSGDTLPRVTAPICTTPDIDRHKRALELIQEAAELLAGTKSLSN